MQLYGDIKQIEDCYMSLNIINNLTCYLGVRVCIYNKRTVVMRDSEWNLCLMQFADDKAFNTYMEENKDKKYKILYDNRVDS